MQRMWRAVVQRHSSWAEHTASTAPLCVKHFAMGWFVPSCCPVPGGEEQRIPTSLSALQTLSMYPHGE